MQNALVNYLIFSIIYAFFGKGDDQHIHSIVKHVFSIVTVCYCLLYLPERDIPST